ncbi:MAG: rhodanese-like domain-containing protein [Hyphomicrobiaceae bacterium]
MPGASIKRIGLLSVALLVVAAAGLWAWQTRYAVSGSQGNFMEVRQAHSKAKAGEVVLVDVRRPSEWKASGVPASGHAITMHQDGKRFLSQLLAAAGGDKTRPLALICATGGRTTWLQARLRKAGFNNLFNVTEGMKGSRYGSGWLKKGLPVRQWTGQASSKPQ